MKRRSRCLVSHVGSLDVGTLLDIETIRSRWSEFRLLSIAGKLRVRVSYVHKEKCNSNDAAQAHATKTNVWSVETAAIGPGTTGGSGVVD